MEANETPTQALAREVREELGVTLTGALRRSFVLPGYPDEFEMRVWIVRRWSGPPANCAPEEHDEIGWFTAKDRTVIAACRFWLPKLDHRGLWLVKMSAP